MSSNRDYFLVGLERAIARSKGAKTKCSTGANNNNTITTIDTSHKSSVTESSKLTDEQYQKLIVQNTIKLIHKGKNKK